MCKPFETIEDMELNPLMNPGHFDEDDDANPCGLIAKTVFNDTFSLQNSNNDGISIKSDDIAWSFDKDNRFQHHDEKQWTDVEDEHFIVWMRVSGLLNFRKLWGRIEEDLDEGEYKLLV
jgi:hypothetical protein